MNGIFIKNFCSLFLFLVKVMSLHRRDQTEINKYELEYFLYNLFLICDVDGKFFQFCLQSFGM